MTKCKWILVIAIVAVFWGLSGWGLWVCTSNFLENRDKVISRTYEGRLYFNQEEYSLFKQYLVDHDELNIVRLEVLASPDPLIDFRFIVEGDVILDYGKLVNTQLYDGFGDILGFAAISLLGIIIFPALGASIVYRFPD